ncbi:MAG: hypothetical protein Q8899_00050 [Weeping tea tree witches'-broom phytoplasma]|uniref:hypothetical protein n=1 Tax=Candidatus Phytoplasma melaleucae TaxID=2982630 RepID=UPI0029399C72|nr:hypothetical protein [Weeping tea tree witches'-broom phytoplasma]
MKHKVLFCFIIIILLFVYFFYVKYIMEKIFLDKENIFYLGNKDQTKTQDFEFYLDNLVDCSVLYKISKKIPYFIGNCSADIKQQILKNFAIVYQNDNIKYDAQKNKIFVANIDSLINTKVYFGTSYIKIFPGIYKYRDNFSIRLDIYFQFKQIKNKYYFNNFLKIKF